MTLAVQASVDSITFAIETSGKTIFTCVARSVGSPVEPVVDTIAPMVETIFYSVPAVVQPILDTVTKLIQTVTGGGAYPRPERLSGWQT